MWYDKKKIDILWNKPRQSVSPGFRVNSLQKEWAVILQLKLEHSTGHPDDPESIGALIIMNHAYTEE